MYRSCLFENEKLKGGRVRHQKRAGQRKPELLLGIFKFLDSKTLQNIRLSSRLTNQLISQNFNMSSNPDLEMVQIRQREDERFICRCLPRNGGQAKSVVADSLESAFEWLLPLVQNSQIRLFSLQNLRLNDDAACILTTMRAGRIQQLSMLGVSLAELSPKLFCYLIENALKSEAYSFNAMRSVHSGHFSDELLESNAFMQANSLEIDVLDFQMISLPCVSIFDRAVIEWFFNGTPIKNDFRILSCNRLKLGPYFVAELVKHFCDETTPKPTSLILCGRVIQCRQSLDPMIDHYKNGLEIVQARNENTGEILRIQLLLTEKIEISRSFYDAKQTNRERLRPVGQSSRAVFV